MRANRLFDLTGVTIYGAVIGCSLRPFTSSSSHFLTSLHVCSAGGVLQHFNQMISPVTQLSIRCNQSSEFALQFCEILVIC